MNLPDKHIKEKTYTIIGSNSYLARHIAHKLLHYGCSFYSYDIQFKSLDNYPAYSTIDITKKGTLKNINLDVDYVLAFSGLTGTHIGFEKYEDFIDVNEKGFLNLLSVMHEKKSKARLIFPSSRLVYKGITDYALKENSEKEFKTIYSLNKFCSEEYLKIFQSCFGIDYTIFRICVPYGNLLDNKFSYGTMGHFFNCALRGDNIVIYGTGGQKRSLIHVDDLSEIIIQAIQIDETRNEIFNAGGPDVFSVLEIARRVADLFDVRVINKEWPELDKRIESGDTIFDSSKVEKLLQYKYEYSFDTWLNKLNVMDN